MKDVRQWAGQVTSGFNEAILSSMREALAACTHPRLFETERGFQGQLLVELAKRVHLPNQAIIEQEYQKRLLAHGLNIRPDIVIHEPYDQRCHSSRASGNIAVVELKLNANAAQAAADFSNLAKMIGVLCYPVGIFVNIGSTKTYAALVPKDAKDRIVTFAISLTEGTVRIIER